MYYSSIPCKISLNVILGNDLSHSKCTSISCVLYLHSSVYHICPLKIFISVKGLLWVSWESRLPLMHMTAAVSFTLCSIDRRGNTKDLSGSTAELTAQAALAINISGNNNLGCLFFPKLSIGMSDLFGRQLLLWQISGLTVTGPCLCAMCMLMLCLPPVKPARCECTQLKQ